MFFDHGAVYSQLSQISDDFIFLPIFVDNVVLVYSLLVLLNESLANAFLVLVGAVGLLPQRGDFEEQNSVAPDIALSRELAF